MEGCELKLVFGQHSSRGCKSCTYGGKAEETMNKSNLQVHVHGESNVVSVSGSAWDERRTSVSLKATGPGNALLRVVSSSMHPTLTGSSNYLALDVRVIVVPAYPIMSVELASWSPSLNALIWREITTCSYPLSACAFATLRRR